MAEKINWLKCAGSPRYWDRKEQEDFCNLRLKSGKVFLIPLHYFNEYLDNNPAFINIESRSLISHEYKGFGTTAIIIFNPQDLIMFKILTGDNVKKKTNDFTYMAALDNRYPYGARIIRWACGTYTEYHPIMDGLLTSSRKRICVPMFSQTSLFYSIKDCFLTYDKFWNDLIYCKKWKAELKPVYNFRLINTINDKRKIYETINQS